MPRFTTNHCDTLIDTIIANWLECPSRLLDDEIQPTENPRDWDIGLLAALADLTEITSMEDGDDTKRTTALQMLQSPCEARCVYANDPQEALDLKALRVEDVESVIRQMGGCKEKVKPQTRVSIAAGEPVPLRLESTEMVPRVATPYPSSQQVSRAGTPDPSYDSLFGSSPSPELIQAPTLPSEQPIRLTPGLWQPPGPLFASRLQPTHAVPHSPVRQRLVLSEERRKLIRARKMRNLRNQLEGQNFGFDRTMTKRELWEMEDEVEDEEQQEQEQEQESKRMRFD
ncbi:hypothetical protein HBH98_141990 [Parastagonospora nodorum]|nr:hypothetical protein HBH50_093480 [Parastagonospora nodorum]KAH4090619.1 hypothetical protein HBH48_097250 [Parastagonospora nodorum]KAH4343962.1 hypothetical protein HBH98_141990 [Parastagonospora nodorum]KAH4372153.1 hypothetical protein HBH97_134370 [Parastagonospora nodorum]KAH4380437.1 hypothetical protein HBH99_196220 [Parastagonospora nodorum]